MPDNRLMQPVHSDRDGFLLRSFQLECAGIELIIRALLGDEIVVRAALDDASVVKDHDRVAVLDRRKAVRDDKDSSPLHQRAGPEARYAYRWSWSPRRGS